MLIVPPLLLQPLTSSAPPPGHVEEISHLQSMVSIVVYFPFTFLDSVLIMVPAFAD